MNRFIKRVSSLAALAFMFIASSAQAIVIYGDFNHLGAMGKQDATNWDFDVYGGGTATLDFELIGYASLDGYQNRGYTDIFHLWLNGVEIFTGSFNLGGGGHNQILHNPNGATAITTTNNATDDPHNSRQVTWSGGQTQITLPVNLLDGANNIYFKYSGKDQGLGDEAWRIGFASLTFPPVVVTESRHLGLLLMGLCGLFWLRRKSTQPDR
jgi:hypothetical protein